MSDPSPPDPLSQPIPRFGLSPATMVAIFIGGALGTVSRYLVDVGHPTAPGHFPWATLVINLSGSLAIGLLLPLTDRLSNRLPQARPFLVVGLLGGWTTFSTLAVDAEQLAQHGHVLTMVTYLAATIVGGLAAVLLGNGLGRPLTESVGAP
jgi:CrcB protein